ncbi:unnamed protein product [Rangifer tarandus platyrhynchus]|uniref:Uncharacterized protein n=2 Tax=Rangifer tarandus platyrhynchus TaxID=3082113 RepID=A0ABN8YSA6_RANTA|nr:unnamed protein product [Rangifer tarandus platyrhynchus]CAI9701670.1 unnamed protein product [Rangifer tarandus platyrhynchus]
MPPRGLQPFLPQRLRPAPQPSPEHRPRLTPGFVRFALLHCSLAWPHLMAETRSQTYTLVAQKAGIDEAWGAVADPLAVTLQLGSSQHSDSASLSLFQILGRAPLSSAEVKRLSPGRNRRGGAESRAVNTEQGRGAGGTQREGAARNTHGGSDRGPLLQNAGGSAGGSVLT